jgi:hypothetical protein
MQEKYAGLLLRCLGFCLLQGSVACVHNLA